MDPASESLFQLMGSQRIAGVDYQRVSQILQSVVERVDELHEKGLVHFDIKPRFPGVELQNECLGVTPAAFALKEHSLDG